MNVYWITEEPIPGTPGAFYTRGESNGDVRQLPHLEEQFKLDFPGVASDEHIMSESHPPAWKATLENLLNDETLGYIDHDTVELNSNVKGLRNIRLKFFREHKHQADEIRFIVEGYCFFDIRNRNNDTHGWYRVKCHPGDIITVPAGRYHRFGYNSQLGGLKAVRLFKENGGWKAQYRYPELFDSE